MYSILTVSFMPHTHTNTYIYIYVFVSLASTFVHMIASIRFWIEPKYITIYSSSSSSHVCCEKIERADKQSTWVLCLIFLFFLRKVNANVKDRKVKTIMSLMSMFHFGALMHLLAAWKCIMNVWTAIVNHYGEQAIKL